jgi:hypothetical protein
MEFLPSPLAGSRSLNFGHGIIIAGGSITTGIMMLGVNIIVGAIVAGTPITMNTNGAFCINTAMSISIGIAGMVKGIGDETD